MLTITDAAGELLTQLLERADAPEGMAIRLTGRGEAFELGTDQPGPDDVVVEYRGRTVLVMDPVYIRTVRGRTLDVQQRRGVPMLALR